MINYKMIIRKILKITLINNISKYKQNRFNLKFYYFYLLKKNLKKNNKYY